MWIALQLVPIMENQFIDDTYANRKGKGTLAAIAKVQKLMRQPRHTWGLQLDIYSYFNSINKRELLTQLHNLIYNSKIKPIAPILPSQSDREDHRAGCHEATKRANWKPILT
ncbi:reverse transcriptase domain-containing protein [Vibrio parahaemolyticus]|uniref:reverse transcriptase domain-containing protein n=1 Tax=Vibrio parahaemolyticus TaxID=670 RepID=UPI0023517537|nr:reverse transcriptase domain-containing protein [Vibrio parahaemolyticus]